MDGTNINTALQESVKGVWNGDLNLMDGKLEELRAEYDEWKTHKCNKPGDVVYLANKFKEDKDHLRKQLSGAAELLKGVDMDLWVRCSLLSK